MTETPITVVTNHVPRTVVYWEQLPESAREQFDYLRSETERADGRFVEYRGAWYDLGEFDTLVGTGYRSELLADGWHGVQTDSAFSAVLVKYVDDTDHGSVVMARATW